MKAILAVGLLALAALSLSQTERSVEQCAWGHAHVPGRNEGGDAVGVAVEGAATAFMENQQTVGLSIGVFKDGKAQTFNFGTTERGKQHSPTAHTLFAIASITKTFTGTLLARAVVERKVRLDDDVRQYLGGDYPNLEYQDNSYTVGLNWQILHSPGQRRIFQDGNVPGFHSMCVFYPELNLGVIVLTNEEVRSTSASLTPIVDRILKAIDPRVAITP